MQEQAVIDHITQWIKDYTSSHSLKGLVIGVSGGIDSAVTSTLCARTGLPLLIVEMPIHQSPEQVDRGVQHIKWLKSKYSNVRSVKVDLTDVFDGFIEQLPTPERSEKEEISLVNSRARLRMTTLYYFAALKDYIVVGTGNRVEDFGIGFFTKYGDGGVDISPIADLMKSEVYAIGRTLGVSQGIINAQPTDGLWGDDRTDADQIGASYDELEWAMEFDGDEEELTDREREVLVIYRTMHRHNRHKMEPIPVCKIPTDLR